jgi:hypothetical protein
MRHAWIARWQLTTWLSMCHHVLAGAVVHVSHLEQLLIGGVVAIASTIGARLLVHTWVLWLHEALSWTAITSAHHAGEWCILAHRKSSVCPSGSSPVLLLVLVGPTIHTSIGYLLLICVLLVHLSHWIYGSIYMILRRQGNLRLDYGQMLDARGFC